MTDNNLLPIVSIIVVAAVLIGLSYATATGIIQISGAELIDETIAIAIVTILFVLMLPWVYKRAKEENST